MTIYWLLFAFPALMALAYPAGAQRDSWSAGQSLTAYAFLAFYTVMGGLRFDVGGDWPNYLEIMEQIRGESLGYAMTITDPLYGALNWVSLALGAEIYLVNTVCCFIIGYGTLAVVRTFREPWLALTMAVPYLLIVVGLGYVRQGAAIGLMLIALTNLERSRPLRTVAYLVLGVGFHSTAAFVFPLFALALAQRYKAFAVIFTAGTAAIFVFFIAPRLGRFETNYIDAEYDSAGAFVRELMGFLPAVLLLIRWRSFPLSGKARLVWLTIALGNILAMGALAVSPSSTAVDRLALYVSVIQLVVFGEAPALIGASRRSLLALRILLIGIAAAVQVVWLIYATNATGWVPYSSVFDA